MATHDDFGGEDLDFSADHALHTEPLHDPSVIEAPPGGEHDAEPPVPRRKKSFLSRVLPLVVMVVVVGGVSAVFVSKAVHMGARREGNARAFNPAALSHLAQARRPAEQASPLVPGGAAKGATMQATPGGFAVPPAPSASVPRVATTGSVPQSFLAPAPAPGVVAQDQATPTASASAVPQLAAVSSSDRAAADAQIERLSSQIAALDDRVTQLSARVQRLAAIRRANPAERPVAYVRSAPAAEHADHRAVRSAREHAQWKRVHDRERAHPGSAHALSLQDYTVKATYPGAGDDVRAWIAGPHGLVESVGVGSEVAGARVLHIDAQDLRVQTTRGVIAAAGPQ
jgi:hypothetical protein